MAQEQFQALRRRMAELTGTDWHDWFLTFKARHGLMVAFGAIHEALGRDVVVTSPFTCVTAVDPILSAGLPVRFADILPDTLWIDPEAVTLADDVAAVVVQHTFGIMSAQDEELVHRAHEVGAVVVEDCAHCVGRMAKDGEGRPLADVSVHSFGVEKMLFGTYFGGAVWVNPTLSATVRDTIRAAFESLPPLRPLLALSCTQYRNQMRVLTRVGDEMAARLRKRWERRGTFEPAVAACERRGIVSHHAALPSPWVAREALTALDGLAKNERVRSDATAAYLDAWGDSARLFGVPGALVAAPREPYLRMPVFLTDTAAADEAIALVARMGYYAQPWPRPLLLPGVTDAGAFGVEGGFACPVAKDRSARVVALPTDIGADAAAEVARALFELYSTSLVGKE